MKAERSRNRGVTLIATLVVLILYAGFTGVLQARVIALVDVAGAVVEGLEAQTDLASARAVLLPDIAEALLVAQEGGTPEFRLDGTDYSWNHDDRSYRFAVLAVRSANSLELLIAEAD